MRRCPIERFIQSRQEISDEAKPSWIFLARLNKFIFDIDESNKCYIVHFTYVISLHIPPLPHAYPE